MRPMRAPTSRRAAAQSRNCAIAARDSATASVSSRIANAGSGEADESQAISRASAAAATRAAPIASAEPLSVCAMSARVREGSPASANRCAQCAACRANRAEFGFQRFVAVALTREMHEVDGGFRRSRDHNRLIGAAICSKGRGGAGEARGLTSPCFPANSAPDFTDGAARGRQPLEYGPANVNDVLRMAGRPCFQPGRPPVDWLWLILP
jgi:hypothetical protein